MFSRRGERININRAANSHLFYEGRSSAHVHRSSIPGTGYRYLVPGERVQVELQTDGQNRVSVRTLEIDSSGRVTGTVKEYETQRGYGLITSEIDDQDYFVHYSNVLRGTGRVDLNVGDKVVFTVGDHEGRIQATEVKLIDPRSAFEQFTNLRDEDFKVLAELAEPEDWSSNSSDSDQGGTGPDHKLLHNYIKYTFLRLNDEGKIAHGTNADGDQVAAFNTGLVTANQQEIYGYFRRLHPESLHGFALIDWTRDSDNRLAGVFEPRPQLASYWTNSRELYFDPALPIYLDTEHFVEDNLDRYPELFQQQKPLAIIATNAAKEQAILRAKRNYKTAIPMFHRGETQLLLPLSLDGSGTAQLALVIKRVKNEYIGETVLTLPQALGNARLLARPDRDWLTG